jgi:fibronectin type 3 domain-containing protein
MNFKLSGITALGLFVLILSNVEIDAQEARLVYKIREMGVDRFCVMLKWYSHDLLNMDGFNLYRLEIPHGKAEKCNRNPIVPLINKPNELQTQDSSLLLFIELLRNKPELFQDGFLQLHLFIKSFESIELSRMLGIFYADSILNSGKKFLYFVNRIQSGKEIFLTKSDTISLPDLHSNRQIHFFSCKQKKNTIEINWKPSDSLFYAVNIYRRDLISQPFTLRNDQPVMISYFEDKDGKYSLPTVFYTDTFGKKKAKYQYCLKGIDFFGEESYFSDTLSILTGDSIAPSIAKNIRLKREDMSVYLSWENPGDNDLRGFNVYRSSFSDSSYSKLNCEILPASQNQFSDKVPETGPWYYRISSLDSSGNESYSEKLYTEIHDIKPPDAPSGLELRQDSGKIQINWCKNKEKDLDGYLIYRVLVQNSAIKPLLINSSPLKDTFYLDKNINSLNEVSYQIAAIDNSSNISKHSTTAIIRMKDGNPPVQPFITGISVRSQSIIVEWLRNPDFDLSYYMISRTSDNVTSEIDRINKNFLSFSDTNIVAGKYYKYQIIAVDSVNNQSHLSGIVGIKATIDEKERKSGSCKLKGKFKRPYIKLNWSELKDENLIGYSIFRKDSIKAFTRLSPVIKNNDFIDKTISMGTKYQYELRIYYSDGNISISEPLILFTPIK